MASNPLVFNGIDGVTGEYLLPPMTPAKLSAILRGEEKDEAYLKELKRWYQYISNKHLAPGEGINPKDIAQTGWGVIFSFQDQANLGRLLGGDRTSALLFTASHGMGFPLGDPRQLPHQGALLCQDWLGPGAERPISPDHYFSADDVSADARLLGLLAFHFACYGAGTPRMDEFARQAFKKPTPIAPHAFVLRLPQKLLGHPKGGALAVVGHVERALGILFFAAAAGLYVLTQNLYVTGLFCGLGVVTFLRFFIGLPLQALEQNLKFITWLGIIYNTYWTRLVGAIDQRTLKQDLKAATDDAITEINRLLDKHEEMSKRRPWLKEPDKS
jgi:hypothetical protein